jgi:hypothetical protein
LRIADAAGSTPAPELLARLGRKAPLIFDDLDRSRALNAMSLSLSLSLLTKKPKNKKHIKVPEILCLEDN